MAERSEPATILIRGGRVIDPASGRDELADVLVMYGRIADVGAGIRRATDRTIDAAGLVVCPGFIDIHVHLREPGQERKETIRTGARAAAAGGFTTVCAMPNTEPPLDTRAACEFVVDQGRRAGGARVLPIGCVSKGRRGEELAELGDLAAGGACAFSDDGDPVRTAALMHRALLYAAMLDRVVIDHCEDPTLSAGGQMHAGVVSAELGLQGKPGVSEDVIVARDLLLAEACGTRVHIAHLSTARSLALVREARRRGVRASCEVTPHHLLLTDEQVRAFDAAAHKMNPPLRSEADRQALLQGLADGTIDCVASDHAPHSQEDKEREWDLAPCGVIGLETTWPVIYTELVETGVISLSRAVELLTVGPVRCLGLDADSQLEASSGTLARGAAADLVVFDPATPFTLGASGFYSAARNSPFAGREVRGRIRYTLVGGRVVHEAD
ncbi:MAG: dihydroorotase [Planctomycetota bacterium]|nr:MAG: dihydroorotase [Planctomycetota bacterium]